MTASARDLEHLERIEPVPGLISIVVPVMNGAATLQRCIDSVSRQTLTSRELIVVDGGSTDGTQDVIRRNAGVTRWVSEPDRGIYDAFNKGVRLSRGEWLLFLGSDDVLWQPDVLQRLAEACAGAYPPQRIVYGGVAVLDEAGQPMELRSRPWSSYRASPVGSWSFEHQGILQHRSLFEVRGLFDTTFRLCGDQELLLRELRDGEARYVPDLVVAGFRWGGASSQPRHLRRLVEERRRAFALNGLEAGRVVSRKTWLKMVGFEAARHALGLPAAEGLARFVGRAGRGTD